MTKSILPNFSIVCFTASANVSGLRTSAATGRHSRPVASESSFAAAWRRSPFRPTMVALTPSCIYAFVCGVHRGNAQCQKRMPHRAFGRGTRIRNVQQFRTRRGWQRTENGTIHTMFWVIVLHIPDPPPVQNKTLPSKRPGWNTVVDEAGTGGGACLVLGFGMLDMMVSARL